MLTDLLEPLEDPLLIRGVDPGAIVVHVDRDLIAEDLRVDLDPGGAGVLHRVVDEVVQDLLHPDGVRAGSTSPTRSR